MRAAALVFFAVFFLVQNPLRSAPSDQLPDGIQTSVGDFTVELRVATPHAFRLHVFKPGVTSPPSIYLSGITPPATPFTAISEGDAVGIKTAFGQLLVDPVANKWALRDADGKPLTDWAPLTQAPGTSVAFSVGPSPEKTHPLFYGSGNTPHVGSLTQTSVKSGPGNGRAGLPQYWSSAGYGALMIGDSDNDPGEWKSNAAGGVDWLVPGAAVDAYLMPAATLGDWLRDDAELTGFAPLPPRWAFGYMQSRWGWVDQAYIEDALAHFRHENLPVDVFILDFEWYTTHPDYAVPPQGDSNFIDFDWNPKLLPKPAEQIAAYGSQGVHIVGIRKPRAGNADTLTMARSKGWILPLNPKDPNGGPTRTRDLDFANPEMRTWWEDQNRKFLEAGMAGFWNDEGETTMTDYSYWNLAETDLLQQVHPGARFWSINRSFCPGVQRFGAAAWTGDIHADWGTLARTPGELLSYGLSGMPYCGCDIGGYAGQTTPELLTRWMQAGVFFPVMRSHSEVSNKPHFPWLWGPEAENAIRDALDLRYRLLPYYYSLGHETADTGMPWMRPLVMAFPDDDKVANLTDEWMMGPSLLAAPILTAENTRSVYLPADTWFQFESTQPLTGPQTLSVTADLDEIPLYVRAGSILPLGPVLQYTGQDSAEPLTVEIYPGHDATYTLTEDDGATTAYSKGQERRTIFTWDDQTRALSWKVDGAFQGPHVFAAMKAVLFAPGGKAGMTAKLGQDGSLHFP